MDSSCGVIRRKLEVADRYARETTESLESDILAEGNAVEDGAESSNTKLIGANCPSEV